MDWQTIGTFLAATLLLLLTPGPIMMIVAGNTLAGGRKAGLLTVLGVGLGKVLLMAVTLVSLLTASHFLPTLCPWVSLAGAGYLAWLAVTMLLISEPPAWGAATCPGRPLVDGLTVASSNPAALLFYAAFLPSFIDKDGALVTQILMLGTLHVTAAVMFNATCVALLARLRSIGWPVGLRRITRLSSAAVYFTTSIAALVAFSEAIR